MKPFVFNALNPNTGAVEMHRKHVAAPRMVWHLVNRIQHVKQPLRHCATAGNSATAHRFAGVEWWVEIFRPTERMMG